ncbi:hypothetical protein DPMN_093024 [Dreissena polymorpha]|uniref:Uncharacterized protein n=1 Tax=Dreissena polymorpha TaxID=45954 RepID=A0A9D4L510_DREPO|nr:hypothetical protein DPMN_093024 [Dreissena polymorpha]
MSINSIDTYQFHNEGGFDIRRTYTALLYKLAFICLPDLEPGGPGFNPHGHEVDRQEHRLAGADRSSIFFLKVKGLSFSITKEGGCGGVGVGTGDGLVVSSNKTVLQRRGHVSNVLVVCSNQPMG